MFHFNQYGWVGYWYFEWLYFEYKEQENVEFTKFVVSLINFAFLIDFEHIHVIIATNTTQEVLYGYL